MSAFGTGFSLLLWVKPESTLLCPETLSEDYDRDSDGSAHSLLSDACTLLGMRWNVEFTISDHEGGKYAFGVVSRFTVSNPTIERALGDLIEHISFIRGNSANTFFELVRYKTCREKWKVKDQSTDSYSGPDETVRPSTSTGTKRRHF